MAKQNRSSHSRGTSKASRKKPAAGGNEAPDVDPVLQPEPLDDLLSETPTPEPSAPLPAPMVPEPTPAQAAPSIEPQPTPTPPLEQPTTPTAPTPAPAEAKPDIVPPPPTPPPAWHSVHEPTPPLHLPHFEPVRPTTSAPSPTPESGATTPSEDEWTRTATKRNGSPELASLGWTLVLVGLALLAATYYWGVAYGNLFAPLGIRGDLIGGLLLLVGLIVGLLFLFVPKNKRAGLGTDASVQEVEHLVRYTNGQVLLSQILAGVGIGLTILGLVWMVYWLRLSYLEDSELRSALGGGDLATYAIGIPLIVTGLFILFFFLGRLGAARRTRNAAVLLMLRTHHGVGPSAGPATAFSSGVSEQEVQDLMKRLDGLMAQLPDPAVTEFSKTKEADTYLKLLGS